MQMDERIPILWVEDDEDDYILLHSLLSNSSSSMFASTWVTTYADALAELEQNRYAVCLLDMHLGAHQGIDLMREAAAQGSETPIIVLTGQGNYELDLTAMQCGAVDFLDKGKVSALALERALRYAVERHRHQMALRDLSLRDDLTSLYNRRGFLIVAQQHLLLARRKGHSALVMFADLDHLKWINDQFGHAAGSQTIIDAANVLRSTFRAADILARLGGDEFVALVIDGTMSHVEAINERLADNLHSLNAQPFRSFELSISVGYAQFDPAGDRSLEDTIMAADRAMYQHKRAKKVERTQ